MTKEETALKLADFIFNFYGSLQESSLKKGRVKVNSHAFHLMLCLYRKKNQQMSLLELSDALHMGKQQLSKLLNDLEDEEYIVRVRYNTNRRIVYIKLTDFGKKHFEAMKEAFANNLAKELADYSREDLSTIVDALSKLHFLN